MGHNLDAPAAVSLTTEQLDVLGAKDAHLVVSAAAGAGKTMVLVERYYRHVVDDGLSPDQILTITFTKKAASEMKERIVKRLREAHRLEVAQIAETGPIQTIHGFCERMLRENAIEAGLDPEFGILGESEATRLLDLCVKQALADSDDELAEDLIHRLAGKRTGAERGQAIGLLESAVGKLLRGGREGGIARLDLLEAYSDPGKVLQTWRKTLLDQCPRDVVPDLSGDSFGKCLAAAYRSVKRAAPIYSLSGSAEADDILAAAQTCGLVALACEAWRLIDAQIEDRQELDFTSLECRAAQLIHGNERVRERVCAAYKVVMVDEGQDVNPVQHKLLDGLSVDCKLMVGDQRQSIYGWRQADVQLFVQQAASMANLDLSENHRSTAGIINFVNSLFGRMWDGHKPMKKRGGQTATFDGVEIWEQKDEDSVEVAGAIQDLISEGTRPGDIAVLVRASSYAAKLARSLERRNVPMRIAGGSERFFVRMEIRDVANAMRALVDPGDDFSLLAALRSPFASLSLDSIALLALQGPVSQRLESFVPPLDADLEPLERFRSWFLPLQKYADRLPAWEVLSEIFARSGYLEALAQRRGRPQQLANVRKLLWMATEQPELGAAEFAEQIREIQGLNHREGDAPVLEDNADVVTIMTIHKAKGLQFPVVVVPNLHKPLDGRREAVEIDPRIPMVATGFENQSTPYLAYLAEKRYKREKEEEERLLYVALTRAQERLCVVAHPNTRKESLAKLVAKNTDLSKAKELGLKIRDLTPSGP